MDGKPHVYWVIDTSATHHIIPSLSNFTSYSYVSPINMKLPNGNLVLTNVSGMVSLSNILSLTHVYYIPTFNVDLISVAKLIDSSLCNLVFTNKQCLTLNPHSRILIGLADRHGDLYVLNAQANSSPHYKSVTCNSDSTISSNIRHRQLAHPSPAVHKSLSSFFPHIQFSNNKDLRCHHFHLAKHKHLSYPNSHSTTNAAFELLHGDIWGPFSTYSNPIIGFFLPLWMISLYSPRSALWPIRLKLINI